MPRQPSLSAAFSALVVVASAIALYRPDLGGGALAASDAAPAQDAALAKLDTPADLPHDLPRPAAPALTPAAAPAMVKPAIVTRPARPQPAPSPPPPALTSDDGAWWLREESARQEPIDHEPHPGR